MVQSIETPDIFGRIGKGLGQGLSESLPKAQERKYLSEGLKKINPQLGEIYAIPGAIEHPEIANTALQYAQSQRGKEAARKLQPQAGGAVQPSEAKPSLVTEEGLPPKFDRNAANYLLPATSQEVDQRAAQLSDETGILFPEAQKIVQRQEDSRLQSEQAFETRNDLGQKEFTSYLDKELNKSGADKYKDIAGQMQNEYETKVQNEIANGASPKQAGLKAAKELLEFAKSRTNLKELGGFFSKRIAGSQEVRGKIDEIRKKYKELGQEENFANDLIAYQGLSSPFANYLASPVKDNKELNNYISGLTNTTTSAFNPFGRNAKSRTEKGGPKFKGKSQTEEQIAKHLVDNKLIHPDDSIFSIALALRGRGYDETKFLNAISDNPKFQRTPRQGHELEQKGKFRPNLNDMFLFSQQGLDKILEQQ